MIASVSIFAFLGLGYEWFHTWRHNFGSEGLARKLAYAQLNQDWKPLYGHALPNERKYVNPRQASELLNWVIWPIFKGFHQVGPVRSAIFPNGSQSVAEIDIENKLGQEYTVHSLVTATDKGYRLCLIGLLSSAWEFKYVTAKGLADTPQNVCAAQLAGYNDSKYIFVKMGLKGLPYTGGPGFSTWASIVKYWRVGTEGPHSLVDEYEADEQLGK